MLKCSPYLPVQLPVSLPCSLFHISHLTFPYNSQRHRAATHSKSTHALFVGWLERTPFTHVFLSNHPSFCALLTHRNGKTLLIQILKMGPQISHSLNRIFSLFDSYSETEILKSQMTSFSVLFLNRAHWVCSWSSGSLAAV